MKTGLSFAAAFFAVLGWASISPAAERPRISRIAFGSCCKQERPMPIWPSIVAAQPDVFLMIGDNIYGDSEDLAVLKAKWDKLGADPGFQQLRKTCPLYATWDDHDYGANDAGVEYPQKVGSQKLFLDFYAEPADP
jgi:alkaline phosphatase D